MVPDVKDGPVLRVGATGVAALVAAAGTALVLPPGDGSAATAALLLAVALVAVVGAAAARATDLWVPAAVVLGTILAVVAVAGPEAVDRLRGPLGYSNATAAWYVGGVAAASTVAASNAGPLARVGAMTAAVALCGLPLLTGASAASAGGLVLVAAVVVVTVRPTLDRVVVVASAIGTVAVAAAGAAVGLLSRDGVPGAVERLLGEARPRLWGEGVDLLLASPWIGWGRHGFVRFAPSAADPDQAWAHNELVELGVEHGLLVPLLVAVAIACAFVALVRVGGGAAAVAAVALLVHVGLATVDHVWHDASVPLTVATVVGAAIGGAWTPRVAPSRAERREATPAGG